MPIEKFFYALAIMILISIGAYTSAYVADPPIETPKSNITFSDRVLNMKDKHKRSLPGTRKKCWHNGLDRLDRHYNQREGTFLKYQDNYTCSMITHDLRQLYALELTRCHFIEVRIADRSEFSIDNATFANTTVVSILSQLTEREFNVHTRYYIFLHYVCNVITEDTWSGQVLKTMKEATTAYQSAEKGILTTEGDIDYITNILEHTLKSERDKAKEKYHKQTARQKESFDVLKTISQSTTDSVKMKKRVNTIQSVVGEIMELIKANRFMSCSLIFFLPINLHVIYLLTCLPLVTSARPVLYSVAILEVIIEVTIKLLWSKSESMKFGIDIDSLAVAIFRLCYTVMEVMILVIYFLRNYLVEKSASKSLPDVQGLIQREIMNTVLNYNQELQG
mmetsp:Transcript_53158/g.64041  ORF Transcript_53158/g.64041 Transcript_53158/m.64041 type:complete len:393 (+) Transcript_53158:180-1358(+)